MSEDSTFFEWEFKRGKAEYRLGRKMPKRPYDKNGRDLPHTQREFYRFAGWMCGRFAYYMKCKAVEDSLRPDPHDPRPRKSPPIRKAA